MASGSSRSRLGATFVALPRQQRLVGELLAAFFVAIFPGNVAQYVEGVDAFGLDSDRARFVRLFFQPVLVLLGAVGRRLAGAAAYGQLARVLTATCLADLDAYWPLHRPGSVRIPLKPGIEHHSAEASAQDEAVLADVDGHRAPVHHVATDQEAGERGRRWPTGSTGAAGGRRTPGRSRSPRARPAPRRSRGW